MLSGAIALLPTTTLAGGDDAMARIVAGDCKGAGDEINDGLARQDPRAYLMAGYLYDVTGCVAHDAKKAARFYRIAMELGDAEARNFLGLMYGLGNGVPQDYQEAYRVFTDGRAGRSEFVAATVESEAATGYAYTVTQLARTKAHYPNTRDYAGPTTIHATLHVATGEIVFSTSDPANTRRFQQEVRSAYAAAFKEAPPLDPAAKRDVVF